MSTYRTLKFYLFIVASIFLAFNETAVSIITFIWINLILLILTIITTRNWKRILLSIIVYGLLLATQICFVIFVLDNSSSIQHEGIFKLLMTYLLLLFSITLQNICEIKNYQNYFFHNNVSKAEVLPLGSLTEYKLALKEKSILVGKTAKFFTKDNIIEILAVINKNNSFQYINDGTLDVDFFDRAKKTLDDPYIYIVLSDTGSVPSKLIALFTDRSYNHSSLSFDKDLNTLVSYNGGEHFQPPGLNAEMIEFLSKKDDATVYVYRLNVGVKQKEAMIDRIKQINEEGSAYNILGLIVKKSYKDNIMYCSQFIYKLMLEQNVHYFDKKPGDVKPTDFVECDYYRKLEFVYEIKFK